MSRRARDRAGAGDQPPAHLVGRQRRLARQYQRRDAADMGGGDRGAGRHLVAAIRRVGEHVDAGRRDRHLRAAVGLTGSSLSSASVAVTPMTSR